MKTLFTFLVTTFFFATSSASIIYLNNNLEAPNIAENLYIEWTDAYAAASAGDTIYVEGSNFMYGMVEIDKSLTVIGPGYFLDQNAQTQVNKKHAMFSRINFVTGSDGSVLSGLYFSDNLRGINIYENVDNITIKNCMVTEIYIDTSNDFVYNDIVIEKCFISDDGLRKDNLRNGIVTDLVLRNNIIAGGVEIADGSSGIITHNLFLGNTLEFGSSSSFEISNNIYLNENEDNFTILPLPDASVHNNISLSGAFGDDNNNMTAPVSTLFVSSEGASSDGQYMLSENSPAIGAGSNENDIGPFGGPDPYRLSGLPDLPNIYELSTGGLVAGDELPVHIKVKQ